MRARGEWPTTDGGLILGLILLALGLFFLLPLVFPGYSLGRLWPILLVGLGIVLVILSLRRRGPGR